MTAALESESRFAALSIRVAAVVALLLSLAAFLLLPKEFGSKAYQLRRSIETVMEALPPELEQMAEAPQAARPAAVPVAATSEAEVEATTIDPTTFVEVVKATEETEIPIVPFWRVEVRPEQINVPKPEYPDMARNAGIEGTAVVEALVDANGSIADARILRTSNNQSLDQAALAAARLATFRPARQRDKPVRVWVSIPYRFALQ
jgi:protein TonB